MYPSANRHCHRVSLAQAINRGVRAIGASQTKLNRGNSSTSSAEDARASIQFSNRGNFQYAMSYISSLPPTTMSFSLNLYLRFDLPSFVANSTSWSSTVKGMVRGNKNSTSIVRPGLLI